MAGRACCAHACVRPPWGCWCSYGDHNHAAQAHNESKQMLPTDGDTAAWALMQLESPESSRQHQEINVQNDGFVLGVIAAWLLGHIARACMLQMLQEYLSEGCGQCRCACGADGMVALRTAAEYPRISRLQLPSHAWRSVALARMGMFYTACDR